jgi:hypothetical protein
MDLTHLSEEELRQRLTHNRRVFVAADDEDSWSIWSLIVPLVAEHERRYRAPSDRR